MRIRALNRWPTLIGALFTCLWVSAASAQGVWPWSQLTAQQKQILAPFQQQWDAWPPADKRSWVVLANRFPQLSAAQQQRARNRINEWASLSGEQRATVRNNIKLSRERKPNERSAEWNRYQQMTPEQKGVLRKSQQAGSRAGNRSVRSGLAPEAAQPLGVRPLKK
jgi:uncharacterized protein YoaH (UPF0181 family)